MERLKQASGSIASWTVASMIAFVMVWLVVDHIKGDRYPELDKRLRAIEVAMECPNNNCDRFKGKDARAMEARLMFQIEARHKENEDRINGLHKR